MKPSQLLQPVAADDDDDIGELEHALNELNAVHDEIAAAIGEDEFDPRSAPAAGL